MFSSPNKLELHPIKKIKKKKKKKKNNKTNLVHDLLQIYESLHKIFHNLR